MEQMKWEDNIKETLEKRTIKPTHKSWDALASKLDASDRNKSKKIYWWMGMAASVAAILFTATVFFNGNGNEIQAPVIVDTQEQIDDQLIPMEKLPVEIQIAEAQQADESPEQIDKTTTNKELVKKQNDLTPTIKQNSSVAKIEKEIIEPLDTNLQNEILEDKKVTEIVAQIQDLKSKGQTITDADIDALLVQAQKEIRYQTMTQGGTLIVDANALLQDVEADLQQSFRNKIFEALKNSYETVKTAVAERNN
ncbi:hypothetical protein [Gelidibacter gilvus]|uniref:Uncharacterized protein n=1 Tax=Gelidibacter gilvus TaxID=59602 RepID=A0A4Q0XCQ3_9FLAO|nr:hypothetical protein [Gelidibacter gilvus]RXJ44534.1 hypothetical protein ESZ48_17120 [Gelidibacter gilvus]